MSAHSNWLYDKPDQLETDDLQSLQWESPLMPCGPDYCPYGRLLGQIKVGPFCMHVECFQVFLTVEGVQHVLLDESETVGQDVYQMLQGGLDLVTLYGRKYGVIIYPYNY